MALSCDAFARLSIWVRGGVTYMMEQRHIGNSFDRRFILLSVILVMNTARQRLFQRTTLTQFGTHVCGRSDVCIRLYWQCDSQDRFNQDDVHRDTELRRKKVEYGRQ